MRKRLYLFSAVLLAAFAFYIVSCNNGSENQQASTSTETKSMSHDEMIKKGDYIVSTGACNDCHSPKMMTQMGPIPDSTKLLSGHPANEPLPPLDPNAGKPTGWIDMSHDVTTFVGPWGISYSANLTPDSATGIGTWTEEQFISTLRNGKHLGNGRPLLPPMPWPDFGKKTDDDLKAVFAYLKSLPAVSNRVPGPVAPPDLMKMAAKK
jgi:cytochrome c2